MPELGLICGRNWHSRLCWCLLLCCCTSISASESSRQDEPDQLYHLVVHRRAGLFPGGALPRSEMRLYVEFSCWDPDVQLGEELYAGFYLSRVVW